MRDLTGRLIVDEKTTETECSRELRRLRNERERKRKEERAAALKGRLAQLDADRTNALIFSQLETLVNQTVIAVEYDPEREGTFSLHFSDGRTATFTSTGDDMTWTSFTLTGGDAS
jgi:ribosomal protein L2